MKEPYELTIIISNYNQEKHIAETIDSALYQRVNFPLKIIVADDYSTKDHSREIIREYAERYENIEAILATENRGYLTNILRAKAITKTKYFCLLDVDDYWTDRNFLQRAYDFLEEHNEYSIYESNVEVFDGINRHPCISPKRRSGTYSKEMFLNGEVVPITQTTGMFLRNSIFINGIPRIMTEAVGTRSERSFEGDTGRFTMHLKYGLAYYDSHIVGVYRLTENGIWNSLRESKKRIITARMQMDYYSYYDSMAPIFINKAYKAFQRYLQEKQHEFIALIREDEYIDEEEHLMVEDVYKFCKEHENDIFREKNGLIDKAKQIYRIMRE